MRRLLAPPLPASPRCSRAPLGLRRVEAALVAAGHERADVAVVPPEALARTIGPGTRVVGLSSGDPLGLGMTSTTMAGLMGGEPCTGAWFRELCARVRFLLERAPEAAVVMGGPGAWQLAHDPDARAGLGIDHVVTGYCEGNVAELFHRLAEGDDLPEVIDGEAAAGAGIPGVLGPTVMGAVEVSRGCGLGCHFCSLREVPMAHLPRETILADVRANVKGGVRDVSLVTEDIFRYGADGSRPVPDALVGLLEAIRSVPGVRLLQTDHANIRSVAEFTDEQLATVRRLLAGSDDEDAFVWLNVGVESASARLLAASGCAPKMGPGAPEDWPEACRCQVRRLIGAGFFPLVSLVVGLPGEQPRDVRQTVEWVEGLRGARAAVFPVLCAPVDGGRAFGVHDMRADHWRLFRLCYALNFKWIPRLFWVNQRRAGVPLGRRLLVQALGHMQVPWWKGLFLWRSARARR
jgi:radical SAM superfamily enzyme YgiQ (UPF0313 family)